MDEIILFDEEYKSWIKDISQRYRDCQIRATVSVNRELISFYWSLGRDIFEKQADSKWGSGLYKRLSQDMKEQFPNSTGFSVRNLR